LTIRKYVVLCGSPAEAFARIHGMDSGGTDIGKRRDMAPQTETTDGGAGRFRSTYVRREPERSVLHGVLREHLETFLAEAKARGGGDGVPGFVERELREYLSCGVMARGFARLRCSGSEPMRTEVEATRWVAPVTAPVARPPPGYTRLRHVPWAELLRRDCEIDALACPDCGGRLRLLATIEDPTIATEILEHLGLEVEPPQPVAAAALTWLPGFEPAWEG